MTLITEPCFEVTALLKSPLRFEYVSGLRNFMALARLEVSVATRANTTKYTTMEKD
jgi:hypothetical protein